MEVNFDSQIFNLQNYGGISRYFSEVIPLLPEYGIQPRLIIKYSGNQYLDKFKNLKGVTYQNNPDKTIRFGQYLINYLTDSVSYLKKPPHILHHTYFSRISSLLPAKHHIMTLYDTLTPDSFLFSIKSYLDKIDKFIAISQVTKDEYVAKYNIDPIKICVIHLASSLKKEKYNRLDLPKKYILYTGNRDGYKNYQTLKCAFITLLPKNPDLYLVCGGGEKLNKSTDQNIYHVPYSSDIELTELITKAQMFVFPSLAEGFGIPILEAFSLGCPVIASDIPVFREVASNSCQYFNATNPSDLADKIISLLKNPTQRQALINLGTRRNKLFTWEKTAQKTAQVYRSLIK